MAEEAFQLGNNKFVDEDYDGALEQFNKAISINPQNPEFLIKRAATQQKLGNLTDAISDANAAIKLSPSNPTTYLRKGTACFALEEYETAKQAFEKGLSLDPSNSAFKTWLRKCDAELRIENEENTRPSQPEPSVVPPTPNSIPKSDPSSHPLPTPKIRHEWYQTPSHVTVEIFAKGVKKDDAKIDIKSKRLDVSLQLPSSEFVLDLDLCEKIIPQESTVSFLSTKIEIKLKKETAGLKWISLEENTFGNIPIPKTIVWPDSSGVNKHEYPSSSKKKKDWNSIIKQEPEEKLDGEEGLNKVFRDIYSNGSEEQRRAMIKSFTESGGTVLSTNWEDVGKKKVEGSAPKGMEMHKWSE